MKNFWCALGMLGVGCALYGQTLAKWTFENVSSAVASLPIRASYTASSCSNAEAYLSGGNNVGTPNACSGENAWATNFWPTSDTHSDGDCMGFTLTARTVDLIISGFSFSANLSSGSGPQQYMLSYYTSTGDWGLLNNGGFGAGWCVSYGADCSILLPQGASVAIQIHPFAQDPSAMAATLRVDNVEISGAQFLPIDLLSFTAKEETDQTVLLNWQTAMESNVSYLAIERSGDAKVFQEITRLPGQGDGFEVRAYQFKDLRPLEACNYYRLKIVDRDSTTSWSEIRVVCLQKSNSFYAKVYPNPTNDKLHLVLPIDLEQTQLKLVDLRGKNWPVQRQGNQLSLAALPTGIYLLLWKTNNRTGTIRVQKT